jgi:hypothetical protein
MWDEVLLFDRMPSGLRITCRDNLGVKENLTRIPIILFKIWIPESIKVSRV